MSYVVGGNELRKQWKDKGLGVNVGYGYVPADESHETQALGQRSQTILAGLTPDPPSDRMKNGSLVIETLKLLPRHPFAVPPPEETPKPSSPPPLDPLASLTLSGLILGEPPKEEGPGVNIPDYMYRGFLFKPGTNLAPAFQNDLSMTPYCAPQPTRPRQVNTEPRGNILPHFEPDHNQPKDKESILEKTEEEEEEEMEGEDTDAEAQREQELLVFFGKPQPIPPTEGPPIFETSEESVIEYIDQHSLDLFFEHVLSLCVLDFHPEPFEFVADYCGKLIEAREDPIKFDELARVFYPTHVAAVYRVFDKQQNGFISLSSYRLGMEVLGLHRYTPNPKGYQTDQISKDTFYKEGCKALEMLLRAFMI